MRSTRVALIGAGLSGLYAAHLLCRIGMRDFVLLEARAQPGGRIAAVAEGFDLGPTWYWPDPQDELDQVIDELGLNAFPQFDAGDRMVERFQQAAVRLPGFSSVPAAMRLQGGMVALIHALQQGLEPHHLHCARVVRRISLQGPQVALEIQTASGDIEALGAEHVLLALPPRLAAASIAFQPALPPDLLRSWRDTPTWMAPHAKYLAVYDRPFWREQGLSGQARSEHGPLVEIHDASMPDGHAALFGFLGLPASTRRRVAAEPLRLHCRAQLARLFGAEAAHPSQDWIRDWALEPFTSTEADGLGTGHLHRSPASGAATGVWPGRLTGIASEWSHSFPGYLAGAIDAARRGVERWRAGSAAASSTTPENFLD